MSGYRQSTYDHNAYERPGPPMRPFNWVQWLGVAFDVAGLTVYLVYIAGKLGWIAPLVDNPTLAIMLIFPGIFLINSRRQPYTDLAPELAPARRRWLIIVVAICAIILGAATVIEFSGV